MTLGKTRFVFVAGLVAYALYLHAAFIVYVRDPIFSPDSIGYAQPAVSLLLGEGFKLDAVHTPGYPLFLYGVLWLTHSFLGVLIAQHLLAMVTGLLAGVFYYRFLWPSFSGAACVAFLTSSLPLPLIYAHYVLTETLYTFLLLVVVYAVSGHRDRRVTADVRLGVWTTLAILTRPVGRSLLGLLGVEPFLNARGAQAWRTAALRLGSAGALLLLFACWNRAQAGFFGLDRMKNVALFTTAAHYLDADRIADPNVRALLTPIYARHAADMPDGSWVYAAADGPVKTLEQAYAPNALNDVFGRLAWQAIRAHPWRFMADRLVIVFRFFWEAAEIPRYYLLPEASYFSYEGLRLYGSLADRVGTRAWSLLHYGPAESAAYFATLHFVPTGRRSGQLPFLPRSANDHAYAYDRVLKTWPPFGGLWICLRALPWVALLAAVLLYRNPKKRGVVTILLLTMGCHVAASTLAAWQDWRFVLPVLPLYWILVIAGIQVKSTSA